MKQHDNARMQSGMAEATRLTREGRISEATAAIQRALGGAAAEPSGTRTKLRAPGGASRPDSAPRWDFDVSAPVIDLPDFPDMPDANRISEALRNFRVAPGVPDAPGGFPGGFPSGVVGASSPSVVPEGGRFLEESYADSGGGRSYKLYVPSGYAGEAVPLIVMLHGCTQSPDDIAAGTRMNLLAEAHTFLVAYPAQNSRANAQRCWNWYEADDQQRGRGEPSLIAGITRRIMSEYNVAGDRVYVAGMSAGGAMAAIMGATYPDLYAAVGTHSGLPPGAARDMPSAFAAMRGGSPGGPVAVGRDANSAAGVEDFARVVPAIVFHGDRDTTVNPCNSDHLLAHYRTAGPDAPNGADGAGPRVATRDGRVPGGYAYTCAVHHDADGEVVAEQWTVRGLGHAWSGGGPGGSYVDPKGPDASMEMVRFFDEHPRR